MSEKNPTNTSSEERAKQLELMNLAVSNIPLFGFDWNAASNVFMRRQTLSRILFLDKIYQKVLNKPGYVLEFGCREGASLSIFTALRGIYEPYNFNRRIYGFDTFHGFPSTSTEDGLGVKSSDLGVPDNWEETLHKILSIHLEDSPLSNLQTTKTISGDVLDSWDEFVASEPSLSVALAVFDMDLYAPTKFVLERVVQFMPKGAVLLFDEFNTSLFPGETRAINEVLGIRNLKLRRSPLHPTGAWVSIS